MSPDQSFPNSGWIHSYVAISVRRVLGEPGGRRTARSAEFGRRRFRSMEDQVASPPLWFPIRTTRVRGFTRGLPDWASELSEGKEGDARRFPPAAWSWRGDVCQWNGLQMGSWAASRDRGARDSSELFRTLKKRRTRRMRRRRRKEERGRGRERERRGRERGRPRGAVEECLVEDMGTVGVKLVDV